MRIEVIEDGFELILGGDTELSTIIEALEFVIKVLIEQSNTARPVVFA